MNPLTNVKNITKLNETELARGTKKSWHDIYKNSAWIFIGGLPYGLTEGDVLAVFSQYGEIVNMNLVRDKKTGKTKGFCFLCYANQKSTVLAVDNFNGIKLCNRTIRVDHVADYKPPKEDERDDEITKILKSEGCAPKSIQINESNTANNSKHEKKKKVKKEKKEKKKKKRKHKSDGSDSDHVKKVKVKEEKYDPGYEKYDISKKKSSENDLCQERVSEKSLGEHSAHKKHRSETFEKCHKSKGKSHERENMQCRSNSCDEERSKYKRKQESNASTRYGRRSVEEMKEYKIYSSSSSSSDDDSDSYSSEDSIRYQNKKHPEDKSHRYKRDCNNSKDEDSSSESSSEKHKSQSSVSEKENYKTRGEKNTAEHRNKDKHRHRRESSDDETTRKDRYSYSKDEKYSDHKSKSKYKNESYYRHSSYYKKDKQDKR